MNGDTADRLRTLAGQVRDVAATLEIRDSDTLDAAIEFANVCHAAGRGVDGKVGAYASKEESQA
jgi:hypothetical protein